MKFVVTVNDLAKRRNRGFDGDYEVLDSGVLKITNSDGSVEHLSP
jgi:hypothetical protein